jgi:hypothetical protein
MNPERIIQWAELDPVDGETPGIPPKRRYKLKTAYRYPVEEGMARMLLALRDRLGAEALRQYIGPLE